MLKFFSNFVATRKFCLHSYPLVNEFQSTLPVDPLQGKYTFSSTWKDSITEKQRKLLQDLLTDLRGFSL